MHIRKLEINCPQDESLKQAEAIRYGSFEPGDMVDLETLGGLVKSGKANYFVLEEGDEVLGLSFCLTFDKVVYMLYLAIKEDVRGKGLGSKTIELLKKEFEKRPIMLDMESIREEGAEDMEERIRRRAFYERFGFIDTGYYLQDDEGMYDLFSTNGILYQEEFMDAMGLCDFLQYHPGIHKVTQ